MQDPCVGTWTLNPAKSQFDPNHRPTATATTAGFDTQLRRFEMRTLWDRV